MEIARLIGECEAHCRLRGSLNNARLIGDCEAYWRLRGSLKIVGLVVDVSALRIQCCSLGMAWLDLVRLIRFDVASECPAWLSVAGVGQSGRRGSVWPAWLI